MQTRTFTGTFGFKESSNCSFCGMPDQDLNHLLRQCQKVKDFRETIEQSMLKVQVGQHGSAEHLFGPEEKTTLSSWSKLTGTYTVIITRRKSCVLQDSRVSYALREKSRNALPKKTTRQRNI